MQRRQRSYSLLSKVILAGVYFVFFAVQVHLRYAFVPYDQVGGQPAATYQAGHIEKQGQASFQQFHSTRQDPKLNKRYFPQSVFEALPAQVIHQQSFTVVELCSPRLVSSLHSFSIFHSFQRGPPSIV
jgi:hypothetical protein